MKQYGLILLAKHWFLGPNDFELQNTILNLLKKKLCFDIKI